MSFINNSDLSRGGRVIREYAADIRSNRKFFDSFDPVFWLVLGLFHPILSLNLTTIELNIIEININKHRQVVWITLISSILLWIGLHNSNHSEFSSSLIISLLAPIIVTGGAWYSITFGGIPEKSINAAIGLTKWLFTAFSISLFSMLIVLSFITPWQVTIVYGVIVFFIFWTAMTFDNVDSLKIGLDDALRKQSLTTLASLAKKGIYPINSEDELNEFIDKHRKNNNE